MKNNPNTALIDPKLSEIARQAPQQINRIRLSKTQLRVLESIKRGETVTPHEIANRCEISQSFASTLLKRLVEKTYLGRRSESSGTGGLNYFYGLIDYAAFGNPLDSISNPSL
ncbi:MarR family transcriptional regulator [Veronia pacifica]|uniref:HTH marR-type domain-containing protein n=1 Tax=Veronia pacifica TaxID=1080227 RepID=A0A1C3E6L6_9GAMM|nr:helix-turn-helix domain-containing protein [Veronia pacifica]ODA28874.1 hypothetical protein A8L45_22930 [Veronia pacifica]